MGYKSRTLLLPFVDEVLKNKLPFDTVKYISTYLAKYIYFYPLESTYILRVKTRKEKHYTPHLVSKYYKH